MLCCVSYDYFLRFIDFWQFEDIRLSRNLTVKYMFVRNKNVNQINSGRIAIFIIVTIIGDILRFRHLKPGIKIKYSKIISPLPFVRDIYGLHNSHVFTESTFEVHCAFSPFLTILFGILSNYICVD